MKRSSEFGTEEEAKPPSFPQWSSWSDFFQIHTLGHGRPCERLNAKQALPRGNIPRSDRGENGSEGPHDVILSFPLGNANTLKLFSHHESLQKNNLHLRPRKHLSHFLRVGTKYNSKKNGHKESKMANQVKERKMDL